MTSQAQIAANRRNAQRSTGPKTTQGKARSALNALKHGIRAQAIINSQLQILGEDPAEFAELLQALVDGFQPVGPFETYLVENIAVSLWRLRRIVNAELGHIAEAQQTIPPDQNNPTLRAQRALPTFPILDRLVRYEGYVQNQLNNSLIALNRLQYYHYLRGVQQAQLNQATSHTNFYGDLIKSLLRHDLRPQSSPNEPNRPNKATLNSPNEANSPDDQTPGPSP